MRITWGFCVGTFILADIESTASYILLILFLAKTYMTNLITWPLRFSLRFKGITGSSSHINDNILLTTTVSLQNSQESPEGYFHSSYVISLEHSSQDIDFVCEENCPVLILKFPLFLPSSPPNSSNTISIQYSW